jgi:hypothetical protein
MELRMKRALQAGVLILVCGAVSAVAQLRLSAPGPIVLHGGSGAMAVRLFNLGTTALPVALRGGSFSDDISQAALPGANIVFAQETGGPVPTYILPGAQLRLQASVSHVAGAVVASAPVFNGTMELGRLEVVEADAPLDLSISGPGDAAARLALTDGTNAEITIKNNDATEYPLDWSFQIDGRGLQSGEVQIAPHGTARIELLPTTDLYAWTDYVRPSSRTGQLLLAMHGPPGVPHELLPQRTLPVKLLMLRLSAGWTSLWSYLFVMALLLLGGLLSLSGNSVLPNILRKIHLRRQIAELGERVSGLSLRVDPYVVTLLRMERKRLALMLNRTWAFTPAAGETLENVSTSLGRLTKRLKVVERMDDLQRKLEEVVSTAPPSVTDDIHTKLRLAAGHLHSFGLTDEEVNAAGRILDEEEKSFAMLSDLDLQARTIATNFRDLKVRQKFLPYSYYNDLKAALPGLFELLNQPFDDFRNIPRQMIFAVDYGISAIQMAFDYAILRAGTAQGTPKAEGAEQSARDRLVARQKELVELLGTLSSPALRDLRALLQEMRENIYEQDVLEEIDAAGQARIVYDPRTVRAYAPILFSIRFKDPRYNDAAALRRLSFKWEFPNEMLDQAWKICHFFQGNEYERGEGRDITVSVRVDGHKSADTTAKSDGKETGRTLRNSLSATFEVMRRERPTYSRAFAEAVRFLIAFGVALAALLSGTLQEVDRLNFIPAAIAILLLGFAVDSIKNLLVQTSRRAVG